MALSYKTQFNFTWILEATDSAPSNEEAPASGLETGDLADKPSETPITGTEEGEEKQSDEPVEGKEALEKDTTEETNVEQPVDNAELQGKYQFFLPNFFCT